MAYQTKPRDPLLEEHMQAAIKKRGSELIGFGLLAIGLLFAVILWSYSPDDPNRFNVTSLPAQNMLGEFGAAIASTLMLTIGKAAWVIPGFALIWGTRFVFHIGEERAVSRVIFSPIFAAVTALFLAAHIPAASWAHSFGLGGLFGDMALGLLVDLNPLSLGFGCGHDDPNTGRRFHHLGPLCPWVYISGIAKNWPFFIDRYNPVLCKPG